MKLRAWKLRTPRPRFGADALADHRSRNPRARSSSASSAYAGSSIAVDPVEGVAIRCIPHPARRPKAATRKRIDAAAWRRPRRPATASRRRCVWMTRSGEAAIVPAAAHAEALARARRNRPAARRPAPCRAGLEQRGRRRHRVPECRTGWSSARRPDATARSQQAIVAPAPAGNRSSAGGNCSCQACSAISPSIAQ